MLFGRNAVGGSFGGVWPRIALLLAGVAAVGCGSEKPGGSTGTEQEPVSWNGQIAPIVSKKCVGCHQPGGIAPMSLEDYATAKAYSGEMLAKVTDGTMPPWGARSTDECTPPDAFKDDPTLTSDEFALLQQWVQAGAPEGAASTKPLPAPAQRTLDHSDVHLTIPTTIDVTGTDDRLVCFSLDPGLTEDEWINGVQVTPGNSEIVHHVLIFADADGQSAALAGTQGSYDCFGGPQLDNPALLGAWAPGGVPTVTPDNVALQLTAGSLLVMQVHYHPHDGVHSGTDSSTSVDLRFAPGAPEFPGELKLIGNLSQADMPAAGGKGYGLMPGPDDPASGPAFVIPPNVTGHTETERVLLPASQLVKQYRIWGVATHMHYVGRDMKIDLMHADGTDDCLLQTPAWDFNWQRVYYYDTPLDSTPIAQPGDVLQMRCTYDNTMDNAAVATALEQRGLSAPVEVSLGETTLDEMCLGAFGIAIEGGI
jgi:mono/diheme cytochrome c family protein